MKLTDAAIRILKQLDALIAQIHSNDFIRRSETLGGATVGQHIRHTLEFFICFQSGYYTGVVNYDRRNHDPMIESDKACAAAVIMRIREFVQDLHHDKRLTLEIGYDTSREHYDSVITNAMRELVYNIEHSVHHMAMIRIGVRDVAPYVVLDADFGVAASSLRYVASSECSTK